VRRRRCARSAGARRAATRSRGARELHRARAEGARDRAALFTGLAPGRYSLLVAQDSLPAGVLPAWRQDEESARAAPGFFRSVVSLAPAESRLVELVIWPSAVVAGTVRRPTGEPAPGVLVRLRGVEREFLAYDARADEEGRFRFDAVLPAAYLATLDPTGAALPDELCAPPPREVAIPVGAGGVAFDLALEAGASRACGRVVDRSGEPVAGLGIACAAGDAASRVLARALTDDEGRFALHRLPPGFAQIHVERRELRARARPRLASRAFDPLPIAIAEGTDLEVGDLVVERPAVYSVRGRVVGAGPRDVEIEARLEGAPRWRLPRRLGVDEQGAFRFECEAGAPPVGLLVRAADGRSASAVVRPVPAGAVERTIDL